MKKIKVLAIDLDGSTLAPGAILTERTIKAIEACKQRGIKVILTTGRSFESAERYRLALGAEGPMVYYNGAIVVDMPRDLVLNAVPVGFNEAMFCVDLAREKDIYCQLYISNNLNSGKTILMAEKDCSEREEYATHTNILAELGDLKDSLHQAGPKGCIKCMFLAEPGILLELRPQLEEHIGKNAYIARTLWNFLEVMDANVSKGFGLKYIMDRYNYRAEEVIAIGDEENDLPMFEVAGLSLAPVNAKEAVKARADLVIGSNAEDGAAAFLEEFFGL